MSENAIKPAELEIHLNEHSQIDEPDGPKVGKKYGRRFEDKSIERFTKNPTGSMSDELLELLVDYLQSKIECELYLDSANHEYFSTSDELKHFLRDDNFKTARRDPPVFKRRKDGQIVSVAGLKMPREFRRHGSSNYFMRLWADYDRKKKTILLFGNLIKYGWRGTVERERISFEGTVISKNGIHYFICRDHLYFEPCVMIVKNKKELVLKNDWLGKEIDRKTSEILHTYKAEKVLKWDFKP